MEGGIILALVGMVTLIVLVLMGVHIAVALGTVGFFGLVACLNLPKAVAMVGIQAYSGIATFDYAVIPLFILMGMLEPESESVQSATTRWPSGWAAFPAAWAWLPRWDAPPSAR